MTMGLLALEDTGGMPVNPGGADGGLVDRPGQVQYGGILFGAGTPAGWRELVGWRDLPEAQLSDTPRPQAHGDYAGAVYGDSATVTYTFLLRGTPQSKAAALRAIEKYAPMDGVERCLAVNDGDGTWCRMARVIGRTVPQEVHYAHGPVECSIQWRAADPRRYALTGTTATVRLPQSSGGLEYPLVYPLVYGDSSSGQLNAENVGTVATPPVVEFIGPLTNPVLVATGRWRLAFNLTLAGGDRLTVDTSAGTALLNSGADRLYTIAPKSDPLERCLVPPGVTTLTLTAQAGTGTARVTIHDARM